MTQEMLRKLNCMGLPEFTVFFNDIMGFPQQGYYVEEKYNAKNKNMANFLMELDCSRFAATVAYLGK